MLAPRIAVWMFPVGLMVIGSGEVAGQDYPSKPIHIITSGVGGSNDFTARQIAQGISSRLGQPVIVDNRAGGVVLAEIISKSPPDGYNLLVTGSSLWIFTLLQKAPYDAVRDFAPISLTDRQVSVVAVHPSLPVKSVKDLIALAKARPGELNYGTGSIGGIEHISAELFKATAGVNIVRIAYRRNAETMMALVGGEVHMSISDAASVMPYVRLGRLRALAVTSAEPSMLAPGLPTVSASGLPGYEATGMTGFFAPGKTPATIVNRLNQEVVRVLNLSDVKERYLNAAAEIVGSSPEEFVAKIKSEIAKWGKVIKDAGIKGE